jgi:hypothetical protein
MVRGCEFVLVFVVLMVFDLGSVAGFEFAAARRLIVQRGGVGLWSDGVGSDE